MSQQDLAAIGVLPIPRCLMRKNEHVCSSLPPLLISNLWSPPRRATETSKIPLTYLKVPLHRQVFVPISLARLSSDYVFCCLCSLGWSIRLVPNYLNQILCHAIWISTRVLPRSKMTGRRKWSEKLYLIYTKAYITLPLWLFSANWLLTVSMPAKEHFPWWSLG